MVRSIGAAAVVVVAVMATAAAEPLVRVVATGAEPACVQNTEVAAAIARHAGRPAEAVAVAEPGAPDFIDVRLRGEGPALQVDVRGGGHDLSRVLGELPCPSIPDVVAAFVASTLAPAPDLGLTASLEAPAERGELDRVREARARLLSEALKPYARWRYRTALVLMGGMTAATAVMLHEVSDGNVWRDRLALGGGALAVASATVGFVAPDDRNANAAAEVGFVVGVGALLIGASFDEGAGGAAADDDNDSFREVSAILGASAVATGVWMAVDHVRERPATAATLIAMRSRLRTPAQRAAVSDAELAELDLQFRSSYRKRYLVLPALGATAALVYAALDDDDEERDIGLVTAGGYLGYMALFAALPGPVSRYERRLRKAGLGVSAAPVRGGTALVLGGRF